MQLKKRYSLLAVVISICCLMSGPLHPLTVYADDLDFSGLTSKPPQVQQEEPEEEEPEEEEQPADPVTGKYQAQIEGITDKLKDLEEEKKEIEQSIQATKTQKEKEQANKNYLDRQISITKDEIALLMERIAMLEENIAEKQKEIERKQAEFDDNYRQFQKRLRVMYMYGETSSLELILGAGSFSDFLNRTETVVRVAGHDRALMQDLTEERRGLEQDKAELEQDKAAVEADKEATQTKKDTLNVQLSAANLKIQDMEEMERQFKADLAKNQAEQAAMQKELERIYEQIEWDKNPYVGGEMTWPVPGFYKISSEYGWRFNNTDFHTGMDIYGTGIYGKSIVAANAGTVKFVNWKYTANKGYGIYLIVDHGGGRSTLYGHCSNIVVKVGDVVTKGQKIAEVGSTGWSTGPHLHFEVRLDGKHTNPKPYVIGR